MSFGKNRFLEKGYVMCLVNDVLCLATPCYVQLTVISYATHCSTFLICLQFLRFLGYFIQYQ